MAAKKNKIKLPKKLKIGRNVWKIRYGSETENFFMDESDVMGLTLLDDRVILINANIPKKYIPEVIVHEIMHASLPVSDGPRKKITSQAHEERIITAMAPGVAEALCKIKLVKL